jgi:RNA polymerase primary sigma factor
MPAPQRLLIDMDAIHSVKARGGHLRASRRDRARDRRKIVHTVQKGEREARQAKQEMVEANLRLVVSIAAAKSL